MGDFAEVEVDGHIFASVVVIDEDKPCRRAEDDLRTRCLAAVAERIFVDIAVSVPDDAIQAVRVHNVVDSDFSSAFRIFAVRDDFLQVFCRFDCGVFAGRIEHFHDA